LIEVELNSKEDVLMKTSCFISGPLKKAMQNAASIFSNELGGWLIPVRMYASFKKAIASLKVKIRDLPEFLVSALADRVPKPCKQYTYTYRGERVRNVERDLPPDMIQNMYPFQRDGV
jgi:hypothetical protein